MNKKGLGWVPDYPDIRDYKLESEQIQALNGERDPLADQIADQIERLNKVNQAMRQIKRHLPPDSLLRQEIDHLEPHVIQEVEPQVIQKDTNQKIIFRNASFASDVLAYGCQGKTVHALREKLKTLGCYSDTLDSSGDPDQVFYDRSIEESIREFQRRQGLTPNGIASSVTLAKIAALSAIAKQAQGSLYLSFGDIGPGVVYLQQKLFTLKAQNKLRVEAIDQEELTGGIFGATTLEAVIAFQKTVFHENKEWDGIVGPKTGEKLQEHFRSDLLSKSDLLQCLTAPIAPIYFEVIKDSFQEILREQEPDLVMDACIDPLIDVMAQSLPFLGFNPDEIYRFLEKSEQTNAMLGECELHNALRKAYDILKHYRLKEAQKAEPLSKRLTLVANQLRSRRGYFPSRELDTFNYGRREKDIDQGPAIIYIQERLRNLGFYKAPKTGYFEDLTEAAVKDFQAAFGIDKEQERESGWVGANTKEVLCKLDEETVQLLDDQIPEVFFRVLRQAIEEENVLKEENVPKPIPSYLRSLASLLVQMVMPVAKQIDLEAAIQDSFETCEAIAQYSLIQQTAQQIWHQAEDRKRHLKRWWKRFQTDTQSEQSQRLLEVVRDRELLDRFEAAIVDIIRSLPKSSKIIKTLYSSLSEDIEDVHASDALQTLKLDLARNIQKMTEAPTFLKSVEPKQPRKPTFIRIDPSALDRVLKGRLYASVSETLDRKLDRSTSLGSLYYELPEAIDLSFWCSPIEDQGSLNACTAHAGIALVEYFERRSFHRYIDASRRFLYKTARNLMQREGDSGASARETMKAMVLFGVPPEEYCPYDEADVDVEPSTFCYAYAQNYQAIRYFRLDDSRLQPDELLAQIKLTLVSGFPCMFGFTVYDSIDHPANLKGHIPYPTQDDRRKGGHSVVAVGYDDYKQVKNKQMKNAQPGAFLIRNSWGTSWGDRGYGWLPYDYVLNGLARDWWSLIKAEWVETGSFGLGSGYDPSSIGQGDDFLPTSRQ